MRMIDLSVVVFPAPLRPSSVTTSPRAISNDAPCNMCDSPYHEWRSRTCNKAPSRAASGMPRSEIGLNHFGMLGDRRVVTLRQDLPSRKHGDVIRQRRDNGQVMLDHQYRALLGNLLDQCRYAFDVLVRHAGGRL